MGKRSKRCPVSKDYFEKCCIAAARHIFDNDWEFRDAHPDLEERFWYYGPPEDAIYFIKENDADLQYNYFYPIMAALCEFSPPTFKKYAQMYLWPEKYGELPSDFFDGADGKYQSRVKKYTSKGRENAGWRGYSEARAVVEYDKAEKERRRLKTIDELPILN